MELILPLLIPAWDVFLTQTGKSNGVSKKIFDILKEMIRSSSVYHRLTALLLPAILLWSWTACVSVCTEITEHTSETTAVSTLDTCGESVGQSSLDDCQFTATPATFQDRQTVNTPVLANAEITFPPIHRAAFVPSVIKSDVNQNSPPQTSVPIFLLLRTFRI